MRNAHEYGYVTCVDPFFIGIGFAIALICRKRFFA